MKEIWKHMALVQQLSSYSKGVKDFSILKEELAADKPVASAAEALYMCKLPRTQFSTSLTASSKDVKFKAIWCNNSQTNTDRLYLFKSEY